MTLPPVPLQFVLPKELQRDVVDVVLVPTAVSPVMLAELQNVLTDQEREKVSHLRIASKRAERIVALAVLRLVLSGMLGTHEYAFCYGSHGKPALDGPWDHVMFNVSHTAGLLAIALTLSRPVGVDVEAVREKLNYRELAQRFFHPEEVAGILALPAEEQRRAFFDVWTRKEAVLKSTGHGLSRGLASFAVDVGEARMSHCTWQDVAASEWVIRDLACGEGFRGSVAMVGPEYTLRYWSVGFSG